MRDLTRALRERAVIQLAPPVIGAAAPMADTAIHLRDAARPLGLDLNPEPARWVPVLDLLVSRPATGGFIPGDRLTGLQLSATDQAWSWGHGEHVRGTCQALALGVAGRDVMLPELHGPGAGVLAHRLRQR